MNNNRLKEFRERAGISQVELARRACMASTNLNSIENGRLAPWPKIKRKLAKVLKTTQEELFPTSKGGQDAE
jgi:DNA-binding XRE family transcriptional regulator